EQRWVSPAFDHAGQHPRQVHGVGNARIHAIASERHPDVRGITAEKDAAIAEAIGYHAPPGPVFLPKNFERERRAYTQDLPDAAIAVDRRQEVVNEPALAAIDREHETPGPGIEAVDCPSSARHHREQVRCEDVRGLYLYHRWVAAEPNADPASHLGMS